MYKLEFKLKQHTPLIHFQHHQEGATLRASEVKPKLDRFLMEKLLNSVGKTQGNGYNEYRLVDTKEVYFDIGKAFIHYVKLNKPEWGKWLVGKGDHAAFDYKLRFQHPSEVETYLPLALDPNTKTFQNRKAQLIKYIYEKLKIEIILIAPSPYFANSDKIKFIQNDVDIEKTKLKELRFAIMHKSDIDVMIFCKNQSLQTIIHENISNFFLLHNFGTRQSKGFGCFTVKSVNNEPISFNEKDLAKVYSTVYKFSTDIDSHNRAFKQIQETYKLIRSGRGASEPGGYKKSLLFLYFAGKANPIRWEKRKIKQEIKINYFKYNDSEIELSYTNDPCFDKTNSRNWIDLPSEYDYQYIRALLGLNEAFELQADSLKVDRNGRTQDVKFKYIVQVKSNNVVERFQSPITCKYINNSIYFCCNRISEHILNSATHPVSFNFDLKLKMNNKLQDNSNFIQNDFVKKLFTPEEFDISDFLKFCFEVQHNDKIQGFLKIVK